MSVFNPGPGTKRLYVISEVRTVRVTAQVWAEDRSEATNHFENGTASRYEEELLGAKDLTIKVDESKGFR